MALSVDMEKQLGAFRLRVKFETGDGLFALLGASGCGKSVTLRCIAGLMTPDRGRIVLNGRVLFDSERRIDLSPQQRRVGYLFQSYALFPRMTVLQNVMAGLHGLPRKQRQAAALEQLRLFRLEHRKDSLPADLSGGEQQRAALARLLAATPEVLLLDEPFSALDDHLQWQLELDMKQTLADYRGDVILVTHSRDQVCRMAKEVCVLTAGQSEPVQSVLELMRSPGTASAALLSGCKNLSAARITGRGRVFCEDWGWELEAGREIPPRCRFVGVRAHSLRPDAERNRLACTVEQVIDNVFSYILMLKTPGPGRLRMERSKEGFCPPSPGDVITVGAAPEEILLLTGGPEP